MLVFKENFKKKLITTFQLRYTFIKKDQLEIGYQMPCMRDRFWEVLFKNFKYKKLFASHNFLSLSRARKQNDTYVVCITFVENRSLQLRILIIRT